MSTRMFLWRYKKNEPAHDKTYDKTCLTSEDSDHAVLSDSSLIPCDVYSSQVIQRLREPLPYRVDVLADAGHTSLIVVFILLWLKY